MFFCVVVPKFNRGRLWSSAVANMFLLRSLMTYSLSSESDQIDSMGYEAVHLYGLGSCV